MAEDTPHRLRWLVLALLLAGAVYLIRSRMAAQPVLDGTAATPSQPPRVADDPDRRAPRPTAALTTAEEALDRDAGPAPERPRPRRTATVEFPPGAAAALPDGSAPGPEYTVKAKAGATLFHGPDSPYFARTRADLWFRTPADARAAGLTEWTPRRRSAD